MPFALLLAILCSGCIAGSIKAHTGVVTDERGRGLQAGVALGFGIATSERSAVLESLGFAGGQAPKAGMAVGLDYVRFLADHDLGMRIGLGGIPLAYGDQAMSGLRAATLFVVRERSSFDRGHEKYGPSTSHASKMAVGIEAMIGLSAYDDGMMKSSAAFGGSAALTWEWYSFSIMR